MNNETKSKPKLGFAFCGSFCTLAKAIAVLSALVEDYEVTPIFSERMAQTDTRFGKAQELTEKIEALCARKALYTVAQAEHIGPQKLFDLLLIAPCTGNTLAKLAHGITDGAVTMAAKAHLRNGRPLVLALASNDALAAGLANIGALITRKNLFFVPFGQDDPLGKPTSLVADFAAIPQTLKAALVGQQLQPLLLGAPHQSPDGVIQ